MNFNEVEEKWKKVWSESKLFEAEPNNMPKFFITAAFPYPNSPQHIGHARTYGVADAYARYKRLQGYNVLFPMGMHVTGTPSLAMAKRVARGEEEIISTFRDIYQIPEEVIQKMKDPKFMVDYFANEIEQGMKEMGFSIDWRRKFKTYDAHFNKFVEWQFRKLYQLGYLTQGSHPVAWCENEKNAVGAHDTKKDIDPEIEEATGIKFFVKDDSGKGDSEKAFFLCMTFRPETIYGVTNLWISPKAKYVKAEINGEKAYISKDAVWYLDGQFKINIVEEVEPSQLLKMKAVNPITGNEIPVLPADFVEPKYGTGVVMSVPAHDVFDFSYLNKLKSENYAEAKGIEPKEVIRIRKMKIENKDYEVEGVPSQFILQIIKDINEAKDVLYREEARNGVMKEAYPGMKASEAREKIKEYIYSSGIGMPVYIISNGPVFCRCGTEVKVKLVENQWFIDYGNQKWKENAKKALSKMKLLPEKTRKNFERVIDWLSLRACARNEGFGTRFILDNTKIIEPLSDSTIYMAFYTIAHIIKEYDAAKINDALFDYVFLGKGDANEVSNSTGIPVHAVERMRESFLYWYPLDSRHSGPDLINNHLTMFIFNHVAIFPEDMWPKQIVTNGFVLMNGAKMSKSLGNILPLRQAIKKYGSDLVRFGVITTGALFEDSDFNTSLIKGIRDRIEFLEECVEKEMSSEEFKQIDYWLYHKLNQKIPKVKEAYENLELRSVAQMAFYDAVNELKHYFDRGGNNKIVVNEFLEKHLIMLEPLLPFTCEELWSRMGHKTIIEKERFPEENAEMIREEVEIAEEYLEKNINDAKEVMKLLEKKGVKPKAVKFIVAGKKKYEIYEKIKSAENKGSAYKVISKMDEPERKIGERLVKDFPLPEALGTEGEFKTIEEAKEYISKELGVGVSVETDESSTDEKAKAAIPMKPAIVVL